MSYVRAVIVELQMVVNYGVIGMIEFEEALQSLRPLV